MVVVVIGGGIVGVSTCYYLSQQGRQCILLERTGIASAASGKAGGFLAGEWGDRLTRELHRRGFELHHTLAEELGVESFRSVPTLSVRYKSQGGRGGRASQTTDNDEKGILLNKETCVASWMDKGTAQVTPKELCEKMIEKAKANGTQVIMQGAKGLSQQEDTGKTTFSVVLDSGETIQADEVVLAMGPWTVQAEDWLGGDRVRVPMVGIASSSLIVQPPEDTRLAHTACFCDEDPETQASLELYPRPDNTLYVCGFGGSPHLQKHKILALNPDTVPFNQSRFPLVLQSLRKLTAQGVLPSQGALEKEEEKESILKQCCMRPCTNDAMPMIGRIPDTNVFIATGHNCWGILLGPITGKVVADLICKGETDLDLSPYNPLRFMHAS